MADVSIEQAGQEDADRVFAPITLAFSGDPFARWAVRDPAKFLATMPHTIRAFGGPGFAHRSVDLLADGSGAAMWLPPGVEPESEELVGLISANADPEILDDLMAVFEQMAAYHPEEPHWYLPLIGVDPARQGQGLGAALMRHGLARCDADGLPAYLESSNPRNMALYLRCGFEPLGAIQAGASPPVVPMLRPAR